MVGWLVDDWGLNFPSIIESLSNHSLSAHSSHKITHRRLLIVSGRLEQYFFVCGWFSLYFGKDNAIMAITTFRVYCWVSRLAIYCSRNEESNHVSNVGLRTKGRSSWDVVGFVIWKWVIWRHLMFWMFSSVIQGNRNGVVSAGHSLWFRIIGKHRVDSFLCFYDQYWKVRYTLNHVPHNKESRKQVPWNIIGLWDRTRTWCLLSALKSKNIQVLCHQIVIHKSTYFELKQAVFKQYRCIQTHL